MNLRKFALGFLLLALSSQAPAKSFAWCQMTGGNYEAYLSGIVEIEDGREAFRAFLTGPFAKSFREYIETSVDPRASRLDCTREDSLFFANDRIDVLINANPGIKFVRTDWRGPVRSVSTQPAKAKPVAAPSQKSAEPKPPWEIEYEQKLASYEQDLAHQQQAVADYERMKTEVAARKAELRAKAEKAKADWEAAVAACKGGNHAACRASKR